MKQHLIYPLNASKYSICVINVFWMLIIEFSKQFILLYKICMRHRFIFSFTTHNVKWQGVMWCKRLSESSWCCQHHTRVLQSHPPASLSLVMVQPQQLAWTTTEAETFVINQSSTNIMTSCDALIQLYLKSRYFTQCKGFKSKFSTFIFCSLEMPVASIL